MDTHTLAFYLSGLNDVHLSFLIRLAETSDPEIESSSPWFEPRMNRRIRPDRRRCTDCEEIAERRTPFLEMFYVFPWESRISNTISWSPFANFSDFSFLLFLLLLFFFLTIRLRNEHFWKICKIHIAQVYEVCSKAKIFHRQKQISVRLPFIEL